MRIFTTGGRGQLGLELARLISLRSGESPSIQLTSTDLDELDITDFRDVHRVIAEFSPDVVINCAAYTDVDGCEAQEEMAMRINGLGAGVLAEAARECGAKILQVSTDYVFDGTGQAPKREEDPVNPINVYGKSKALGERLVREGNPRHFILRTAWLYGEGHNFVRTMLGLAGQRDELNVVDDQIGTPTSTVDLAECILNLIKTENYGIYHGTCEGACSWYQFAQQIFAIRGIRIKLNPIMTEELNRPARRPRYSVLENSRLNSLGLNNFRPWEEALREYLGRKSD